MHVFRSGSIRHNVPELEHFAATRLVADLAERVLCVLTSKERNDLDDSQLGPRKTAMLEIRERSSATAQEMV